jgi:hypothetical protein
MPDGFADVVVCLPSVRARAAALAETLAQWRRFGVTPLVELQPDDWPLGSSSQRRTAERALRRALDARPDAAYVLFTEDDVDLSPDLPTWLPALKQLNAPVTLYVTGHLHYPLRIQRQLRAHAPLEEGIVQIVAQHRWYGTLAVLLPRELVEDVLCWESGATGWDVQLQSFLTARHIRVSVTVPNLAQHRGLPTSASPGRGHERSLTFGQPHSGGGTSPPYV